MTIKIGSKKNKALEMAIQNMYEAMQSGDEEQQQQAFENYSVALADSMKDEVTAEVNRIEEGRIDDSIMSKRAGRMQLTSNEKRFFAEAVEKQKIDGLDETFPTTIIETILEELSEEHPILSAVDTQYTKAVIKWIYRKKGEQTAYWDVIPADIKQILLEAFGEMDLAASKLSGFIALPKGYFKLGPTWLAQYVLTYLKEVMQATLEDAVINGDGKLKPIGMMRKLSGATDGVYPEKDAVKINDLTPKSLAGPRALLSQEKMLNGEISMIVNPVTYETKVNPALFFQDTVSGIWKKLALPNGEKYIPSYAVPQGKAVLGNVKNYMLAVAGQLDITKYTETLAIEDMDLFVAKMYAAGVAKDPNAFVVLDLSDVEGVTVPDADPNADLETQDTINPPKGDEGN